MPHHATKPARRPQPPLAAVVMGVSGCGKTAVGRAVADRLGWHFVEGDGLHPAANVAKMSGGVPLTDEDRWPWLDAVAAAVAGEADAGRRCVVACSALRRRYRDWLRQAAGGELLFVHLRAPFETIRRRMTERADHFMKASMLTSQFETLEPLQPDEAGLLVDASRPVEAVVAEVAAVLRRL